MRESGGTVDVSENTDELRKELTRFASDSKCFLDTVELLKRNPHLLSASDKLLLERELTHWSKLVSSLAITEGLTIREWLCQVHHHTTTINDPGTSSSDSLQPILASTLPPLSVLGKSTASASISVSAIQPEINSVVTSDLFESFFNQQPRAAQQQVTVGSFWRPETAISKTKKCASVKTEIFESLFNHHQSTRVTERVVWQLEVLWPEWTSQISKPGSTDSIGKWCYICRYCDVILGEEKQRFLQKYDWSSGDVVHSPSLVSASACEDVLSHFLSLEHFSSAYLLKDLPLFTREIAVVTGKFFQQSNAQLGMYCKYGDSRVYPARKPLLIADVVIYRMNDSDMNKRLFKVVLRFGYSNNGSSDLLLRFETAGVNPNLRHKISSYSLRDDNDAIIASSNDESVPAEYILVPGEERTFSASVNIVGALEYSCSFGLFFLVAELDSVSGSFLAAGVLHAVPLVKVVDLAIRMSRKAQQ